MSPLDLAAGRKPLGGGRILIVEDEFLSAMAMEAVLQIAGFAVVGIAGDADSALAMAEVTKPDLVITDVNLRGPVDGISVATALRERWDIPCLVVSGNINAATRSRASAAAPVGFLEKPYDDARLVRLVRSALRREAPAERRAAFVDTGAGSVAGQLA